jgi:hypothetical protein
MATSEMLRKTYVAGSCPIYKDLGHFGIEADQSFMVWFLAKLEPDLAGSS